MRFPSALPDCRGDLPQERAGAERNPAQSFRGLHRSGETLRMSNGAGRAPGSRKCQAVKRKGESTMKAPHLKLAMLIGAAALMGPAAIAPATAASPVKGGILKFVVPDEPPSFDGHKETTFALIHPIAPFYSVLIRVNPDNPATLTDFVCDLCTEMPKPGDGGKTYTFKIRSGVKFHDGSPLSAKDVHATFERIIFPQEGVSSARQAQFGMVEGVTSPD